jgi:hydrogenase maturation protease
MDIATTVRCAVFSVGNALRTDDGIGEALLSELEREGAPEGVRLVRAGADPLRIVQELADVDRALVLDAADMGLEPGAVRVFEARDVGSTVRLRRRPAHGLDMATVAELAARLGLAHKLRFVAVQPASIAPGVGLSPALRACLPDLVRRVRREVLEQSADTADDAD